jgi:hypothetical protein
LPVPAVPPASMSAAVPTAAGLFARPYFACWPLVPPTRGPSEMLHAPPCSPATRTRISSRCGQCVIIPKSCERACSGRYPNFAHDLSKAKGDRNGKTENANPQFRKEDTVFKSPAGMPGRFASNFDFQLAGILGASASGGAAVGECYATISKVKDGDQRGWSDAWEETATRIEETASRCESEGHAISAAEAYLRASTYWRAAGFFLERADKNRIAFWNRGSTHNRTVSGVSELTAAPLPPRTVRLWVEPRSTGSAGRD